MTKGTKISLTVFAIVMVGLLIYLSFTIRRQYYGPEQFVPTTGSQTGSGVAPTADSAGTTTGSDSADTGTSADTTGQDEENVPAEQNGYLDISKSDCDNRCVNYIETAQKKYCEQVCGLTEKDGSTHPDSDTSAPKQTVRTDCGSLSDLEHDYCQKDLAVSKKDISACNGIEDAGIQKTCRNRIAQDLLESK